MPATSKDIILKKIQKALSNSTGVPFADTITTSPIFAKDTTELEILFAENFTKLQGNFSFCMEMEETTNQLMQLAKHKNWSKWYCNDEMLKRRLEENGWPYGWHPDVVSCNASITGCEALVARTGTLVLSSKASGGRVASVYAPAHICIAHTTQLAFNIDDAIHIIEKKYDGHLPSLISFASGPSRTADIEKTLVTGVHGPKEVYCFLIDK